MIPPQPVQGLRGHYVSHPERGAKHTCSGCAVRFFDLLRSPVTCPVCGVVQAPRLVPTYSGRAAAKRWQTRPATGPKAAEQVAADEPADEVAEDDTALLDPPDDDDDEDAVEVEAEVGVDRDET